MESIKEMTVGVLASILIVGLLLIMGVLWQLRSAVLRLIQSQQSQAAGDTVNPTLSRQMAEIHQSMGGVINGLKAVGNQMHYLNQLAGYALQTAQPENPQGPQQQAPQILIQMRPAGNSPDQPDQPVLTPEDLPPELQERYRIFQAVYHAILANPDFPSRERPDLN